MTASSISDIRRFNRTVTQRIGVLQDSYLSRGRPLGEARLLFEIGLGGADVRDLRNRLALDSGYMSRLLRSLEKQGLISLTKDVDDARARRVELTGDGRREWQSYDDASNELANSLLSGLDPKAQDRLVSAMTEVERLLSTASVQLSVEAPDSLDARWCLDQYVKELAGRFDGGFDPANGNTVSSTEMTPPSGYFVVARQDGTPVGCGGLIRRSADAAEIKRMWTSPSARGRGVARRILAMLEDIARDEGFSRVLLDTNRSLNEARALYARCGYVEIARYNQNPYAHHFFEKTL